MAKLVTMEDIAKNLNVSKSLVSRAISNSYGVNPQTREMIIKEAQNLGYHFKSESNLPKQPDNITIVLNHSEEFGRDYYYDIAHSIEIEFSKMNTNVIFSVIADNDTDAIPLKLKSTKTSGIIAIGRFNLANLQSLIQLNVPLVLVDSHHLHLNVDEVATNNYEGCYQATKLLVDKGHRKISFVGSIYYSVSFKERYRGYCDCINEHLNLNIQTKDIIGNHDSLSVPFNSAELYSTIPDIFKPTAIVCANDPTAIILYDMFEKKSLIIPEDISIIGFDNVEKCDWVSPKLSSIDSDISSLGKIAADLLTRRISNPAGKKEKILVETSLVDRFSVARN